METNLEEVGLRELHSDPSRTNFWSVYVLSYVV